MTRERVAEGDACSVKEEAAVMVVTGKGAIETGIAVVTVEHEGVTNRGKVPANLMLSPTPLDFRLDERATGKALEDTVTGLRRNLAPARACGEWRTDHTCLLS